MNKCRNCKGELVDGPDADREATVDGITCRVRGIPTRRCAAGCAGVYWYWLDFGVEVYDAWASNQEQTAKRPWFSFKPRHLCRACGKDLVDAQMQNTFEFTVPLRKGTQAHMSLTAPALRCLPCNRFYLAAPTSKFDSFYTRLSTALDAALVKDLIHE